LVGCATGDGNPLLDAGPNALGEIPADQAARLRELGAWLKQYGPSIYATRGGPYRNGRWGGSTCRGNTVYLHVATWKTDQLELPPLKAKILACANFTDPQARPGLEQTDRGVHLTRAAGSPEAVDTVIALTLSSPAENEFNHGEPLTVP
jgi:alpha-L-fucosidase